MSDAPPKPDAPTDAARRGAGFARISAIGTMTEALSLLLPRKAPQRASKDTKPSSAPDSDADTKSKPLQLPIPPALARIIRTLWILTTTFIGTLVFAALVLTAGIGSAWYAVHSGLPFNTYRSGSWVIWTHVGSLDQDPYSQARFAQMGALTTGSDRVVRFEARADNDGRRLHSACTYELNSPPINANYWTIGVFDTYGRLIPNAADRYGFSIASVARDARGAFRIVLSRDAQP